MTHDRADAATGQSAPARPAPTAWAKLAWGLGRTPLLIIVLYALRQQILDLIEETVDIVGVTEFVISVAATPVTRIGLGAIAGLAFFGVAKASARLAGARAYPAAVGGAVVVAAILSAALAGGVKVIAITLLLAATNWAPLSALARAGLAGPGLDRAIAFVPALGEALLASHWLDWLGALWRGRAQARWTDPPRVWPGALIAAAALALAFPSVKLAPFERVLRSGPDVRVIAHGDFNGLAYDKTARRLFATGHGVARLESFDVDALDAPPRTAQTDTGHSQGLSYDPAGGVIYAYSSSAQALLGLDARTLALRQTIPAPDLSPGDPWFAVDPLSNTIAIISEADKKIGKAFMVFDRRTGVVLDRRDLDAGNLLIHPTRPILYFCFFRRGASVSAYDLNTRQIIASAPTDARVDRMAYDRAHNEILIASPAESRIQRFDADTLAPRGAFRAIFGVRVIDIDMGRRLMLTGSLATGQVALMGLDDRTIKQTWYLGPWLRTIVMAPDRGVAYVSSQGTLYELRYARGS